MPSLLVDTHCHLDATAFDGDRDVVVEAATAARVGGIVVPAIEVANFARVASVARRVSGGAYALGIHPLYTPQADRRDIETLRTAVEAALDDPRFVAIGEIGLDLFVPTLATPEAVERQTWFLDQQLKIARDHDLPVLLHVRRAQDPVLAALRRVRRGRGDRSATGIAHAFNGSRQQGDAYRALGFRLGFGGAATFDRALRIRALAADLPVDAIVLETDAPDIAPSWLRADDGGPGRNAPAELRGIAEAIAALRGIDVDALAMRTTDNAKTVLPRLRTLLDDVGRRREATAGGDG